ncbi:putative aspartic-type endopeptidase CTSD [Grifola frondosa]|uniref:Putative aspartic-type endopeptidase CTSD n=1 Tax=Grifola frondosa TaxID=5627 RepID=A0A1C7LXE2_GRIFR|nr:putative aspartic-type endopeptidase CTSD [Grifola frondosa]
MTETTLVRPGGCQQADPQRSCAHGYTVFVFRCCLAVTLVSPIALSELAGATRLGFTARRGQNLQRRASVTGSTTVADVGNVEYTTDITLGGSQFTVQIDTGSSDLWVAGPVPNTQSTGKTANVQYAVGDANGSVYTATLEFAGYTVENQAFINVPVTSDHPTGNGLMGLGPNYGSQVQDAIGNSAGDAVLDRIFRQNTSTPNYITFLLGRANDPADTLSGDLTVGEILPGYENITSQPKLSVTNVASSNIGNQHWQTLLDADGIIGPAGNNVIDDEGIETSVDSTSNKKQLTVIFDTGYSLPQVPADVAKAFYSDVPGAELVDSQEAGGNIWQIPCDKEVNITFKFGGIRIPIHPLDTSINLTDSNGNSVCYGAFQPATTSSSTYDMIFGMAFLRNAYAYINFGDFVDGSTNKTADPYIQLLSLTNNSAEAHSDFLKVRGDSPWTPNADTSFGAEVHAHLPIVIGVCAGVAVLLLIAIAACCCCGKRRSRGGRAPFFQRSYQPLHDPAPEAYDLRHVGHTQPPSYSNPWDARY